MVAPAGVFVGSWSNSRLVADSDKSVKHKLTSFSVGVIDVSDVAR